MLFANAGLGALEPLGKISEESFDKVFTVNVKGTLFTVQKALPLMKAGGSIILTGSTTGTMGTNAFSVYSASKAAIRNFARSWAVHLKGTGTEQWPALPVSPALQMRAVPGGERGGWRSQAMPE